MRFKKIILKFTLTAVITLVVAIAVIGYSHTSSGRQTWLGKKVMTTLVSICPITRIDTHKIDAFMEIGLRKIRGEDKAPLRPALQFALDQTTENEVIDEMKTRGVPCEEKRVGYLLLHCSRSPTDDTTFVFGGNGKLKSISVYRTNLNEDTAQTIWMNTALNLKSKLGPPTHRLGNLELTPSHDILDVHSYEYQFRDYYAKVSILNKGHGRALYERYQSTL